MPWANIKLPFLGWGVLLFVNLCGVFLATSLEGGGLGGVRQGITKHVVVLWANG